MPLDSMFSPKTAIRPSSDWCETELKKPYVHESGHAVIARLTGFEVAWVSVDHNFIQNDPTAIANNCSPNCPTCMTLASKRMTPILNKRSPLNKQEKEVVFNYCMQVLAGPLAEFRFDPKSFNELSSLQDFHQVYTVLQVINPNVKLCKQAITAAKRRVSKLLSEHWLSVLKVADALEQCKTLTGAEIDQIIHT